MPLDCNEKYGFKKCKLVVKGRSDVAKQVSNKDLITSDCLDASGLPQHVADGKVPNSMRYAQIGPDAAAKLLKAALVWHLVAINHGLGVLLLPCL